MLKQRTDCPDSQGAESGTSVRELIRKYGFSQQDFLPLEIQVQGHGVSDVLRLKELEEKNRRLKRLVADQALDIQILKDVNSKKR